MEVVGHGIAQVVNAETRAFIVADVWFCLIGVIGGLLTGSLGYLIAARRWAAAAGLIAGALAASAVALWVGDLDGYAAFQHQLAVSAPGTRLNASLALRAKSGLIFWPMLAALTIVVIELLIRFRSASRRAAGPPASPRDRRRPGRRSPVPFPVPVPVPDRRPAPERALDHDEVPRLVPPVVGCGGGRGQMASSSPPEGAGSVSTRPDLRA